MDVCYFLEKMLSASIHDQFFGGIEKYNTVMEFVFFIFM